MEDSELYQIGIKKECFSYKLLFKYIIYALWHSFVVYMVCFYALNSVGVNQNDGRDIGLWVGGMTVYGCCIFLANLVLGLHSKTYEWRYFVLLSLGPIAYFLFYWILNMVFIGDIAYLFVPNYSIVIVWIAIFFCLIFTGILDAIREIYSDFNQITNDLSKVVEQAEDTK